MQVVARDDEAVGLSGSLTRGRPDRRGVPGGVGDLKYYNGAVHHGLFALPNFVRELTATAERSRIVPERRAASAK